MIEIADPTADSTREPDAILPDALPRRERSSDVRKPLADALFPLALAVATIALGFSAGGYFADEIGWAAATVAIALAISSLASGRPPGRLRGPLGVAAGALALFGLWVLASAIWSDAPGRSLAEFNRVLLYLGVLLLFGAAPRPATVLRNIPVAFVGAAALLCAAGLWVRTQPGSWPFDLPPENGRMDWPLTYENALGALAALGLVLGLHVAAWRGRSAVVRLGAAAVLPILAAALVLTFSRGGTVAVVVGIAAYVLLGFSRSLVITLLAVAGPVAAAAVAAWQADLLGGAATRSPAALAQGEDVAFVLILATAVAIVAMGAGMALDRKLGFRRRRRRSRRLRRLRQVDRRKVALVGAACAVLGIGAFVASGAPSRLYDRTQDGPVQPEGGPERERLTDTRAQSRAKYWSVSLDAFRAEPLHGSGAGAFVEDWNRDREVAEDAAEGHSLYVETLGELGVVGAALLFAALAAMLWPLVAGLRGRRRRLYAGLAAGAITWLVHAGLDWDWEMPVLTLWLVATCGAALGIARQRSNAVRRRSGWRARAIAAGACVIASLTPATFALSQNRVDDSARALTAGDCSGADVAARKATDWVAARPEPYAIRAYCAARTGNEAEAVTLMESAREREPRNWKYSYGLALMQAVNGDDPRPAARRALELNPLEDMTVSSVEWFSTGTPRQWRRRALAAPVPRP